MASQPLVGGLLREVSPVSRIETGRLVDPVRKGSHPQQASRSSLSAAISAFERWSKSLHEHLRPRDIADSLILALHDLGVAPAAVALVDQETSKLGDWSGVAQGELKTALRWELVWQGSRLGIVSLGGPYARGDSEKLATAHALCNQAALALYNASRYEERLRESEALAALYEVATMIASRLDIREILETVVDAAKKLSGSEKTVLCLVDGEASPPAIDARTLLVRGRRSRYPESWWRRLIDDVGPEVLLTGTPRYIKDEACALDSEAQIGCFYCLPLGVESRTVGLLVAVTPCDHPLSNSARSLLTLLSSFAAVAIENARLVTRSKRALLEGERKRIAREMHDGLAQSLFSLSLNLEICVKKLATDPDATRARLIKLQHIASSDLRALREYIFDLRPEENGSVGLVKAIRSHFRGQILSGRIAFRLDVHGKERPIDYSVEQAALRIVQEASANILKHAEAENLNVTLKYGLKNLTILIEDNGKGFEVRGKTQSSRSKCFGIMGMRERAEEVGGRLSIRSALGTGTSVKAVLPLEGKEGR